MRAREIRQSTFGRPGLWLVLMTACVFARVTVARCDEEAPRQSEWVEIKLADDRAVRALVARPQDAVAETVVVILHEDRGLTSWERRLTDQIAAAGFIAIAPDLLSDVASKGSGTDSFETVAAARAAIYDLKSERIAAQFEAVVNYAQHLPGENKRVVVVGFGWGGAQAFLNAARSRDVDATVVFYGAAPPVEQLNQIKGPVFGFYAENDSRITGEVTRIRQQLLIAGQYFQPVTYLGASQGFFRSGEAKDASPADRKARSEAWTRLIEILRGD